MRTRVMVVGLVASGLLLAGCQKDEPMVTGTVDTTKILRFDSQYQDLAQDYFNERVKLAGELNKAVGAAPEKTLDKATYAKFAQAEADLNAKWLGRTRDFTKTRLEKIQAAAESVCREKGIDLVVLDSDEFPTVEFGGVDITSDILDQMPGFAGGATQGPAAASPAGESSK